MTSGHGRPVRLVLATELLQAGQLSPQGAVEVADDRGDPRHGHLGHRVQVGVVADACQQRFEALAGGQRRAVLAHHLQGSHRRRPQQLGLGVGFQRVGGGQQLVDPAASLTQVVPQPPEHPQDPEQMRQRPAVVGQVPAHRGGQIGRLRLQPPGRVILVEAP